MVKRPQERPTYRREDIKRDLKETGWALVNTLMDLRVP
jgi:hypothetical protein